MNVYEISSRKLVLTNLMYSRQLHFTYGKFLKYKPKLATLINNINLFSH